MLRSACGNLSQIRTNFINNTIEPLNERVSQVAERIFARFPSISAYCLSIFKAKPVDLRQPRGVITWEMIVQLSVSDLALRHISSPERANREFTEGVNLGDALSISSGIKHLINHLHQQHKITFHDDYPSFFNPFAGASANADQRTLSAEYIDKFTLQERKIICTEFEKALMGFIDNSYNFDVHVHKDDPNALINWIEGESRTTSFLLVTDMHRPFDEHAYYNLGKIGKQDIDTSRMRAVFYPNPNIQPVYERSRWTGRVDIVRSTDRTVVEVEYATLQRILAVALPNLSLCAT